MRILVADDELTGRLLLERALRRDGHEVLSAVNGREAVDIFEREWPDLVLMDAQMPVLSGYSAARVIKSMAGEQFVPIVFVTGNESEEDLVHCVECGGDDFITKPFSLVILRAKMAALERVRVLQASLRERNAELGQHRRNLIREQKVAQRLFEKIVHTGDLDAGNMTYLISSMAIFNGDLILAARRPEGGQHILLGDFTGHGLPAAMGAIPVARAFYAMTRRGFSLARILAEINDQLVDLLPTEVFLAAVVMELDDATGRLSIWNGGIPDVLVRGADGLRGVVSSSHLPLGLVGSAALRLDMEFLSLEPGDRLYAFTDGVIETQNAAGEQFGEKRIAEYVGSVEDPDEIVKGIELALVEFRGGRGQSDDVTLLEVQYIPGFTQAEESVRSGERPPLTWSAGFEVAADALRSIDPLPHLVTLISDVQGLAPARQQLQTVFAELYANALDHGVLGLDSAIKSSPEGFARYYSERERRLSSLSEGYVRFHLEHHPRPGGGRLEIEVEDSGPGFDHAHLTPQADNRGLFGRGIPLLRSLCAEVQHLGAGNRVRVAYDWS